MRLSMLALFAAAAGSAWPALAENAVIAGAVNGYVRPAYETFHSATTRLRGDMDSLCAEQSPDRLAAARNTFLTAVATWSEVEPVRFGPVTQENRLERILFWPDRKGIGLKQVQAALAEKDATAADAATLENKSVAMQGLGALEFVLFGTGSEALSEPGDGYRCAYGRAVAVNIDDIAAAVLAAWQDPSGIARQWSNPGPENPLYRNDQEAMVELMGIVVHGLEMTRDVRIGGFLGQAPDDDKPRQAIFWRSGGTVISIKGNLLGLRKLFDASGLATLLSQDSAWIVQSVTFEFARSEQVLDIAAGPIQEVLDDPDRRQALVVARLITSHLSELFGVTLAGEIGISAGFSSLDGD